MICALFGHRDAPDSLKPLLAERLTELIEKEGVTSFLVGQQGAFDRMAIRELKRLKMTHPHIQITIVLAYLPEGKVEEPEMLDTVYPEGLEYVPRRFAISRRNDWMIKQSEIIVAYVTRRVGGAAKIVEKAERQGKRIVSVAPSDNIHS